MIQYKYDSFETRDVYKHDIVHNLYMRYKS